MIFFLSTSCNKSKIISNERTNLDITFRATFGEENLVIGKTYDYETITIVFTKVSFYMANINIATETLETKLSDIEFIDITKTHTSETLAAEGMSILFTYIPMNEYTALNFDIGVPSTLNKTTPSDHPNNHPLGMLNNEEYSEELGGYLFAKIEGQFDVKGENLPFVYHAGMDRDYQEIEIDDIVVSEELIDLNFRFDIKKLFSLPEGRLLNLNQNPPDQRAAIVHIMENFKRALTLK